MHTAHYFKEMLYDKLLPSNQPLSKNVGIYLPPPRRDNVTAIRLIDHICM